MSNVCVLICFFQPGPSFKRPKQDALTQVTVKRVRKTVSYNEVLSGPSKLSKLATLTGYPSEDEQGAESSDEEPISAMRRFSKKPFSHWNNAPTTTGSLLKLQQRSQSESAVSAILAMDKSESRFISLVIGFYSPLTVARLKYST